MQRTTQPYVFLAFLIGALALVVVLFKPFFTPLALAAVFAVVFHPLYRRLKGLMGGEALPSLATVLIACLVVVIVIGGVATQIAFEATRLYTSLASGALDFTIPQEALTLLAQYAPSIQVADLSEYARSALIWLIGNLDSVLGGITRTIFDLLLFLIALYYLLKDGERLAEAVVRASPLPDRDDAEILGKLHAAINSVLRGTIAIALIQGTLTGIGFLIFGVPNAALWGTIAALAALVPGLGTALVIAPAIAYLFFTGSTISALGLLAWGAAAVGMIDNFLGPRLMGHGIKMHPLLMLLAVLGGLALFGPIGFLAGPLAVSLFLALLDIYTERRIAA